MKTGLKLWRICHLVLDRAIKGDYLRDVGYCLRYLGWKKTNGTMVFRDMWHSGGDDSGHPDILLCKEKDGTCLPVLPVVVELPDSEPSDGWRCQCGS